MRWLKERYCSKPVTRNIIVRSLTAIYALKLDCWTTKKESHTKKRREEHGSTVDAADFMRIKIEMEHNPCY